LHDARIECSVIRTRTSYTIPFVVSAIAGKTKTKAKKVNKRAFLLTLASEKADIRAKAINGSFGTLKRIVFMAIATFWIEF
jgi:hypothetical protein